jgi:hypothetical protein
MEPGKVRVSPSGVGLLGTLVKGNVEDYRGRGMAYGSLEEDGRPQQQNGGSSYPL